MDGRELRSLGRDVRNYLEYLGALGVTALPRVQTPDLPNFEPPVKAETISTEITEPETLEAIRADLGECTRCPLHQGRTHIVFGEGPAAARIMFVGEGPGRDEDQQGVPFVGAAGQLLTDIIVKGMQLRREDCYIGNIVKCRPPQNRDPLPDEANTCLPFLKRQIAAIRPQVIVALGRVAAQYLLNQDQPLARLRNRFHDFEGIPVMPTYHPAALLRDPRRKRDTWEDIKLVLAKLDLPA
jgi:uracil-DNA glycosylase family 4